MIGLFRTGFVVVSGEASDALRAQASGTVKAIRGYVAQHMWGAHGTIPDKVKAHNFLAIGRKAAILSRYDLPDGQSLRVVTSADRQFTTVKLETEE